MGVAQPATSPFRYSRHGLSLAKEKAMNDVNRIKKILSGKTMVLVGGDERPEHKKRLLAAFGLLDVIWIETRDSDPSSRRFASIVRRAEVAIVVALSGLLRHQHIRDLRTLCRELGRPLLTYWRSPHPEGLAAAITAQKLRI